MADPQQPMSLEQFGQHIKSVHPEYADMADADVGQKVLAKYPQYKDMVQQPASAPPTATIGSNEPQGAQEGIVNYLRQMEGDVRYGTGQTFAGKLLRAMGAQGTDVGAQGSMNPAYKPSGPVTGTLTAAQGAASGDVKQTLSGLGEAATLPSMAMGGPEAGAVINKIPSAKYAGKQLAEVTQAAKTIPIDPTLPGRVASEAESLANSGAQLPKVIRNFIQRSGKPDPISFEEARKFYTNATKLSITDRLATNPPMKRQVALFTDALNKAITEAAAQVGQADKYVSAVTEYHRAKQLQTATAATGAAAVGAIKLGAADSYIKSVLGR